jgi:membrane protein implicated in regulation of membrane protease activity
MKLLLVCCAVLVVGYVPALMLAGNGALILAILFVPVNAAVSVTSLAALLVLRRRKADEQGRQTRTLAAGFMGTLVTSIVLVTLSLVQLEGFSWMGH